MYNTKTVCEYCGKTKEGLSFCIGASSKQDWTMIYGTGKMTCPDCYEKAEREGEDRIQKHISSFNR